MRRRCRCTGGTTTVRYTSSTTCAWRSRSAWSAPSISIATRHLHNNYDDIPSDAEFQGMAKLIVISSDERQEFELGEYNSIGRHPDNTIQVLDRIISKEHAAVQRLPDKRFLLRDLRSLNGTFVRGDRVTERILDDGDEITMGSTRLLFVERENEDDALHRVTIAPGLAESHIRQRIAASSGEFLSEKQIADDTVLRRDYERLRIGHELAKA